MPSSARRSLALSSVLGLWLGGTLFMWGVAIYNFRGIPHSFERNPRLASAAGFDPSDEKALKTSLVWVHASELNRVFFETWGWVQVALAVLTIALAWGSSRWVLVLVTVALLLALFSSLYLVPTIVELGRELDFAPREPPPPTLADFGKWHGISLLVDLIRGLLLVGSLGVLIGTRSKPSAPPIPKSSGDASSPAVR